MSFGRDEFLEATGVSRETLDRLESFVALLESWNQRINLISKHSLGEVWRRHLFDCAQLFDLLPNERSVVVDIGSGAGFPGLILAVMGAKNVHLVESDRRKCVFLREALRETNTRATVHEQRIEKLPSFAADVVVARAVADVEKLLEMAERHLAPGGICLFPKGAGVASELTAAQKLWHISMEVIPSRTSSSGSILRIGGVCRVDGSRGSAD